MSATEHVLPPFDPGVSHFERLGLQPRVDIDREQLEANYLERSQVVHPDRYVQSGPAEQRRAMEHAAALNEAYAVLRDRTRRAEYLVKLGGIDLDSSDVEHGAPKPSQAFLIDMIERREGVERARLEGAEAIEDLRDEVEDERAAKIRSAEAALERGELPAAAEALVAARYLARLIEELEGALEA